jgi:hypothetical protein
MSHLTGNMFGIGTPGIYPMSQNPWGLSQGFGAQALPQQSYGQTFPNPFIGGGYGVGAYGMSTVPPLQQAVQLLQIVPQQLQQLQLLQQQQLAHLQQLLLVVPAQLQQLQQILQSVPQQVQQHQQPWQPFGAGASGPTGFGLIPPAFAGQATSNVM